MERRPGMSAPTQRGDEAELFARHHDMLLRDVSRQASAAAALIEDACAFAWAQLLRYQPQRDNIVAWLVTVAVREAWTLSRRQRAEISGEVEASDAYAHLEHIGATLDDQVSAREALRAVAELPERQPASRRQCGRRARKAPPPRGGCQAIPVVRRAAVRRRGCPLGRRGPLVPPRACPRGDPPGGRRGPL